MRFQSTFEKITQGTSQQLFAFCFVALRVAVGVACLYVATQLAGAGAATTGLEPGTTSYDMQLADFQAIKTLFIPAIVSIGFCFILGVLVRPIALLAIVFVLINATTSGSINPEGVIISHGLLVLVLSLFAVGGSGHALGLDGIISRNIRRPNALTKFLFG